MPLGIWVPVEYYGTSAPVLLASQAAFALKNPATAIAKVWISLFPAGGPRQ